MDVRRLLKVYNYVNDEKKPKVNLKFAAALAAFVLASGLLIAYALAQRDATTCPPACTSEVAHGSPGGESGPSYTIYVGLSSSEISIGGDLTKMAEERLREWRAAHPTYVIDYEDPVEQLGATVGFNVTYHERLPPPT